ncbi:MAG: hypothetical protein ABI665_06145 [Vicinamibacterales bacterium]
MAVMTWRMTVGCGAVILVAAAMGAGIEAKPNNSPVRVEFSVPPDVKPGDEVSTILRFRALENVEQLDVAVSPFVGLELLSEPRTATFRNVTKGAAPELEVRIRLTAEKWGSLAVVLETRTAAGSAADAITIVFGDAK